MRTKRVAHAAVDGNSAPSNGARPGAYLEDFPLTPDAINSDLGYVYEPTGATATLSRDYGWTHDDGSGEAPPLKTSRDW
jgi:hypothetical protein